MTGIDDFSDISVGYVDQNSGFPSCAEDPGNPGYISMDLQYAEPALDPAATDAAVLSHEEPLPPEIEIPAEDPEPEHAEEIPEEDIPVPAEEPEPEMPEEEMPMQGTKYTIPESDSGSSIRG